MVIQGIGNVGSNAGEIFIEHGHKVIAISDSKGAAYNANGLDIKTLSEYKKSTGSLKDFPDSTYMTNEEMLALPCDVLIPAALRMSLPPRTQAMCKPRSY